MTHMSLSRPVLVVEVARRGDGKREVPVRQHPPSSPESSSGRISPRRGAFTVVVLISLFVGGILLASLLRLALLQQRQLRYEQARLQATWLAVSGLDRAVRRLALEPGYTGETWMIEPAHLGSTDAGSVVVRVENSADIPANQRTVIVESVYPAEGPHQARITRQSTFTLSGEP